MDNIEPWCVFYVKVGTFHRLEYSTICVLTVTKMGIVRRTVQHDLIDFVSFMKYPRDFLRQTSADIVSLKDFPVYIWQSGDFGCGTLLFIPVQKHKTSDWLTTNRGTVGNPCNIQTYAPGFLLSRTCVLAVGWSILTSSKQYIPQNYPLLFVIIFLSYCTPANHGYTKTSARWQRIQIEQIDRRFIQCVTCWHPATTQTPVSPLQCSQSPPQHLT